MLTKDYRRVFVKTNESIPYIGVKDFKNLYPIYSIDLIHQPLRISDVKSNIILHVDFNKQIQEPTGSDEGTVCYVFVVPKYLLLYEPIENLITEKIN
jgi:hypothetical protein